MSEFPAPLVPADVDLRDFQFMPLDVRRLRDSDLAAQESTEACWAAVLLWGASWHQVPAGSLPDNDRTLAGFAGFGKVVSAWLEVRAGALHNFVKCSDGRLYHPVVAEKALEAWKGKLKQRWLTECARIKKANQRHGTDLPFPTFEEFLEARDTVSQGTPANVPEDTPECPQGQGLLSLDCPPGNTIQGTGTGTGTGTSKKDATASSSSKDDTKPKAKPKTTPTPKTYPQPFEQAWKAYPHTKGRSSKPKALGYWRRLPPEVRAALPAAVARYARDGREPRMDCGAPAMDRWLNRNLYADWLQAPDASTSPAHVAPEVLAHRLKHLRDTGEWREAWGPKPNGKDTP